MRDKKIKAEIHNMFQQLKNPEYDVEQKADDSAALDFLRKFKELYLRSKPTLPMPEWYYFDYWWHLFPFENSLITHNFKTAVHELEDIYYMNKPNFYGAGLRTNIIDLLQKYVT